MTASPLSPWRVGQRWVGGIIWEIPDHNIPCGERALVSVAIGSGHGGGRNREAGLPALVELSFRIVIRRLLDLYFDTRIIQFEQGQAKSELVMPTIVQLYLPIPKGGQECHFSDIYWP